MFLSEYSFALVIDTWEAVISNYIVINELKNKYYFFIEFPKKTASLNFIFCKVLLKIK